MGKKSKKKKEMKIKKYKMVKKEGLGLKAGRKVWHSENQDILAAKYIEGQFCRTLISHIVQV